MKTTLIEGKQPAKLDPILFVAMDLTSATRQAVWREGMLVGIRNEHGEIYRVIGITGMNNFVQLIKTLHKLGYRHDHATVDEAKQGFHEIVKTCSP